MDKVAHAVGMDPLELRILNAYRDGDMKAHRREAKNCALIECAQVAAEKAKWPLREEFRKMSSLTGGGGDRAVIPATVTDENGRIGRRQRPPTPRPPRPAPVLEPTPMAAQPPAAPPLQASEPPSQPAPPAPTPRPAANRFSSIFGTRRR
jgi:hypothetical protein